MFVFHDRLNLAMSLWRLWWQWLPSLDPYTLSRNGYCLRWNAHDQSIQIPLVVSKITINQHAASRCCPNSIYLVTLLPTSWSKIALTSVDENETGLNDGCIIIDKSPTAAHTANWCARFSHLCHRQSWSKQSSPMQRRLWQAACLLQQPLIYQFEILCPLHCVFKKWLNHTMSLPQLWIPMFVNIWSIHSFEERLSGDWKFCNQLFAMYPFITIISTTQHSANKCLMYAPCFDKAVPNAWVYDCPVMW